MTWPFMQQFSANCNQKLTVWTDLQHQQNIASKHTPSLPFWSCRKRLCFVFVIFAGCNLQVRSFLLGNWYQWLSLFTILWKYWLSRVNSSKKLPTIKVTTASAGCVWHGSELPYFLWLSLTMGSQNYRSIPNVFEMYMIFFKYIKKAYITNINTFHFRKLKYK